MSVFFVISYTITKPEEWKKVTKEILRLFRERRDKYKMLKSLRFFMYDIGGQMIRSIHIEEFDNYADLENYLKIVESDSEMAELHNRLLNTLNIESIKRYTWKDLLRNDWLE
jgi:hypothetical protein